MSSIQSNLPNAEALREKLEQVLSSNLPDFLAATHTRRQEYAASQKYALLAIVFLSALALALFFVGRGSSEWIFNLLLVFIVLWLAALIVVGNKWLGTSRLLARELGMAIVPILSNTINRTVMYTHNSEFRVLTRELLRESNLMTESDVDFESDDMYSVYGDCEVSLREIVLHKKFVGKNGKEQKKEVFRGVFVFANLNQMHAGETYVSTEGDRTGFAHRLFWTNLFEKGAVKETKLEWNDFENDLHVASTDPVAARELLTPDFMQFLHEWWSEHKLNMRISFVGSQMFMLLPEESVVFGYATASTRPGVITKYACSILRPLWRTMVLVEGVLKAKS